MKIKSKCVFSNGYVPLNTGVLDICCLMLLTAQDLHLSDSSSLFNENRAIPAVVFSNSSNTSRRA